MMSHAQNESSSAINLLPRGRPPVGPNQRCDSPNPRSGSSTPNSLPGVHPRFVLVAAGRISAAFIGKKTQ